MRSLLLSLVLLVAFCAAALAAEQEKIYGPTPPSTFALYALDPELVGGWNTPLRDYEKRYIPEKYQSLPVLGGWYGQGYIPDREMLLASGLKKAFLLAVGGKPIPSIQKTLAGIGMDVVTVPGGKVGEIAPCFLAMGKHFRREERGNALAQYSAQALERVSSAMEGLPEEQRTRVYLALGSNGMNSVCHGSDREEPLLLAGGQSVLQCPKATANAMPCIDFEQLASYDPDVVLVFYPTLMRRIETDPKWSKLRAVREGKVYFLPRGPFSWFERPATYMRVLGIQWLANTIHPERYKVDIKAESKAFMELFFNLKLTPQQIDDFFVPYGSF